MGDIRQCGMLVGIELVKDKKTKTDFAPEQKIGIKVCNAIRKRGIFLRPLGDVIVLMPPLSITNNEIMYLISNLEKTIKDNKIMNRTFYLVIPEVTDIGIQMNICLERLASLNLKAKQLKDYL